MEGPTTIDSLKPYPKMRDSEVLWLGQVPEHWELRKLRQVLNRKAVRNHPELPLLSVVRERGVILRDTTSKEGNHNYIPDDLSNYKVVRFGQFAMNKMKAWQGSYGVSQHDGIVSPAYFVFEVVGVAGDFFHAAIRSRAYVPFFTKASDGVRIGQWDLSEARMKGIPFIVPPQAEQATIVRFLAHAERRIRRYINAKQKLVKLLEEQKRVIIHRAVTRGLDPDVRLKHSGVEWLGDVPENWEVVPFKQRVRFQEGPGIMAADFRPSGIPLLRISCLLSKNDALEGCNHLDPAKVDRKWSHFRIKDGDFILNASTSASTILVCPPNRSWIGAVPYTGLIRLWSESKSVSMKFISLLIQSPTVQGQLLLARTGVGIAHFGPSHLKKLWIALPKIEEQEAIVRSLERLTAGLDRAISAAQNEVALFHEYRTRLISDVVTGKLDVRGAVANMPDEAEEPEPLEQEDASANPDDAGTDNLDAPEEAEQ